MMSSKDVYEIDNAIRLVYLLMSATSILKDKCIDVGVLQGCFERNETVKEYLEFSDDCWNCEEEQLTQEEFDLLKEVLSR